MDSASTSDSKDKQISFNIYQYDAQLALAFQADCEALLKKFSQLKSYKFEDFANLWKETCFMAIFDGLEYILMLQVFIENCFFIAKKFLFSFDPYVQVGAIYVLYALYYKQPIRAWVKIRLTQVETDKMNHIVDFHRVKNANEILFIYSKMRLDQAFYYCALSQPLGLDAKYSKRVDLTSKDINQRSITHTNLFEKFKDLIETDSLLKDLQETDREYQNLVKKYKEKCKQLYVFPSNIRKEIQQAYERIIDDSPTENGESRIQEIKNKAMGNKNATYRAEMKLITGVDLDTAPK